MPRVQGIITVVIKIYSSKEMSDRLQLFREQMAAFEGTSDPQKAIEKGYFIQQPRHSLASQINC